MKVDLSNYIPSIQWEPAKKAVVGYAPYIIGAIGVGVGVGTMWALSGRGSAGLLESTDGYHSVAFSLMDKGGQPMEAIWFPVLRTKEVLSSSSAPEVGASLSEDVLAIAAVVGQSSVDVASSVANAVLSTLKLGWSATTASYRGVELGLRAVRPLKFPAAGLAMAGLVLVPLLS